MASHFDILLVLSGFELVMTGQEQVGTCSSVQMLGMVAQLTVMTHNQLQSPGFDCNWNSQQEESVSVKDSEVLIWALATHRGTKVMVNSKEVSSKLTKADFTVKADCSVCHMVKTTAPWVWQKESGCTADSSSQIVLKWMIICEECYECVCA